MIYRKGQTNKIRSLITAFQKDSYCLPITNLCSTVVLQSATMYYKKYFKISFYD